MQTKTLFIYFSMIILIGLVIMFVSDETEAYAPDITISLDESEVEVDVGPDVNHEKHFFGMVKYNGYVQSVDVSMSALVGDFPTSITPHFFTLQPDHNEERFEIVTQVPKYMSVGTYTIIAYGSATPNPGGVSYHLEPAEAILKIKPYMEISMLSIHDNIIGNAGEKVEIPMTIKNMGNHAELFEVTMSDSNESDVTDWRISIIPDTTDLIEAWQNQTVMVRIRIPEDTPVGKYELIVSITAGEESEGTAFEEEYSLFINVRLDDSSYLDMWPWLVSSIVVVFLIFLVIWRKKRRKL